MVWELTCDKNMFKSALTLAQRAISRQLINRSNTVLLRILPEMMGVIGSNTNFEYVVTIPVESNITRFDELFLSVDITLLLKVISRCKSSSITLTNDEDSSTLKLSAGAFTAELALAADIPAFFDMNGVTWTELIDVKPIASLAKAVTWAADRNNIRPNMDVCKISSNDGKLYMQATDTTVICSAYVPSEVEIPTLLIPVHVMEELSKLENEEAVLSVSEKMLSLRKDNGVVVVTLCSKLVNANYPNIDATLEKCRPVQTIQVSSLALSDMLTKLSILPKKDFNVSGGDVIFPISVVYKDDMLIFDDTRPTLSVHDELDVNGMGADPFKFDMDMKKLGKALTGCLNSRSEDMISLSYSGDKLPIVITGDNFTAAVMVMII